MINEKIRKKTGGIESELNFKLNCHLFAAKCTNMGLKIFKAMWFVSMVGALVNLLYIYASMPETIVLNDQGGSVVSASREGFFYGMMSIIGLVNFMVYPVAKVYKMNLDLRAWFHGLVITLNVFFVIAMNFVGLFNSGDRFDYSKIEFIIYGSILLFVAWAVGWPLYALYKKIFIKQSVENT